MATTYTLPDVTTVVGTFGVVLTAATSGLTQPTVNTIVEIGSVRETLDVAPGVISLSTCQMTCADDYTVHANGFWYEVTQGDCNILITLDEGSGDTLVFFGKVQPEETEFEEKYVSGTTYRRVMTLTLKSLLTELENVTIADLLTEADSHLVTESLTLYQHCTFGALFASALKLAFSQTYAIGDVYETSDTLSDWVFNAGASSWTFLQLSWRYKYNSASPPTENWQRVYYTDSTNAAYFGNRYGNAWELIKGICENFGVVPRHVYDLATSTHKIQILQRGTNYDASVSLPTPLKSTVFPGSFMLMGDLQVSRVADVSHTWYSHKKSVVSGAPSAYYRPDTIIEMLFVFNAIGVGEYEKICGLTSTTENYITSVLVWDYLDTGAASYASASYSYAFQRAMVGYMMGRYYGTGQITYHRDYPAYKVDGGSHANIELMKQLTINSDSYQVIDCDKNFTTGTLKLTAVKI